MLKIKKSHLRNLDYQCSETVHDGASRSKVVERDKRVHLELGRGEKALDHVQAHSFKGNTTELEENTGQDKLDLAKRSNDNTEHNDGDVAESLVVWRGGAHDPASDQDSNWSGGLRVM